MLRGALFSEIWNRRRGADVSVEEGAPAERRGRRGRNGALRRALLEAVHHGRHVAALALALFEPLAPRFALDMRWARMLAQAALWHDLGFAAGGRRRHHKRSMEIIEENVFLSLSFGLTEK